MLRSLTDRPNVEATLILSRKDGSIIKSSGFEPVSKKQRALSSAPEIPTEQSKSPEDGVNEEPPKATPAEELAASVFQFMTAAGALGSTLASVSVRQEREDGSFQQELKSGKPQPGNEESIDLHTDSAEAQVQLLRLRIKQKEVIIFPDPRYICCVVQRIGKHAAADGR